MIKFLMTKPDAPYWLIFLCFFFGHIVGEYLAGFINGVLGWVN